MTERDYVSQPSGYFPSAWPAECGGPRRQKVTRAKGLALSAGERLKATTRILGDELWPVMFVHRNHGELYLQGGTRIGQRRASFGWVKQLDPIFTGNHTGDTEASLRRAQLVWCRLCS